MVNKYELSFDQKMKLLILFITVIFISSCTPRLGQKEYLELDKVSTSDHNKRQAVFSAYPVEKQIDIYLYAWYGREGGGIDTLSYLISNGESKIPQILKRLDQSTEPRDKAVLLNSLKHIDMHCHCISSDPQIIEILERTEFKIRYEAENEHVELYHTYLKDLKSAKIESSNSK